MFIHVCLQAGGRPSDAQLRINNLTVTIVTTSKKLNNLRLVSCQYTLRASDILMVGLQLSTQCALLVSWRFRHSDGWSSTVDSVCSVGFLRFRHSNG